MEIDKIFITIGKYVLLSIIVLVLKNIILICHPSYLVQNGVEYILEYFKIFLLFIFAVFYFCIIHT